jgi:hypothetical protein
MKPPAPDVVRKGALVRVAGGPADEGAQLIALAFLDLRFADGHVERWLGPGSTGRLPGEPDAMASLQAWARESVGDLAAEIMGDVARDYAVPDHSVVDALACDEVVIEWHSEPFWS